MSDIDTCRAVEARLTQESFAGRFPKLLTVNYSGKLWYWNTEIPIYKHVGILPENRISIIRTRRFEIISRLETLFVSTLNAIQAKIV